MWLLLFPACVWASVQVLEPASLIAELQKRGDTVLKAAFAEFAASPLSSLVGELTQISSPDLCTVDAPDLPKPDLILLAYRGGCSFVEKALQAQRLGAIALLVVDNTEERLEDVHMIDPTHSEWLRIPILMVSQQDGQLLVSALQSEPVVLKLDLNQPLRSSVSFKLLLSADSYSVFKFIDSFRHFVLQFDHTLLQFEPFYAFYYDTYCKRNNFTECSNPDCIGNGRYCSRDTWDLGAEGGRDVVVESLRQLCLWRTAPEKWFAYVSLFGEKCLKGDFGVTCSASVLKELDIAGELVDKCVQDSIEDGDIDTSDNSVLRDAAARLSYLHIRQLPGMALNNEEYTGPWETETVQAMVCSLYADPPKACQHSKSEDKGVGVGDVLLALVFLGIAGWGTWVFRQALQNRREKTEVATAFSKYYSLPS